jgi:hypothetical protein
MKRLAKTLFAFSLLGAGCSAATVTISQPSASTTSSPVQVDASVSGSSRVLQLYVDGHKTYQVHDTSMSTSVSMSNGIHRLAVQSMDSSGNISKTVKYVTVQAGTNPPPPSPPPPPPPSGGTTFSNLQEESNWQTCGSCGDSGGGGALATYVMTRGLTDPTVDGSSTSAEFKISGTTPYSNGYWYRGNTSVPKKPVQKLVYDFYLWIPAAYVNAPQAIEFECQHEVNGYTYNYAWQADYPSHTWRTFDYSARKWVSTNVPFTGFAGDTWHHIVAEYHADGTNTVHDAITVDGVRTVVNVVHAAKHTGQSWDALTNAFQLDLNGKPAAFKVYVDKMNVNFQ